MATTKANTVNSYISVYPKDVQKILQLFRKTIINAAPAAEEIISYGMPAYKLNGMLVYFAGYKNHIGFYATPNGHSTFKKELSKYKQGKGSVQFPLSEPIPYALITKIVQFRIAENASKVKSKKNILLKKKPILIKPTEEEKIKLWMNNLAEPVRKEIDAVRKIIKGSNIKLSERIKWNAPSYFYKDDIVTFGPYKKDKLLLVFHHPTVVKIKSDLLTGNYKDRRLVCFKNSKEAIKRKTDLQIIINAIIKSIDN